jgi:2-desacetyl-2-hydroxyethyl bacteriochlorophyllide A dehydrogenase
MSAPGRIEYREIAAPSPEAGEVLLRIRRIGVCGSDIHVWHGKHPFTSYPVVQGHEFSATVEKVGPGVTDLRPGTTVTARPQIVCGECASCLRGDYNICNKLKVQGFQAPGCAQDLFIAPRNRVVPLPDEMSFEKGALVEPAAVAAHATGRAGDLKGLSVAVLGAGTIGNLVAQAARCRGARKVLISDTSQFRLEKAKTCGIDATCNVREEKLEATARRVFGNAAFDVAFEAAGSEMALDDAVQNVVKGGKIVAVGVFEQKPRVDISILGDRELSLIGTLMYKQEDYEQAVRWIASGAIQADPLITKHFPFDRYADAYHFIEQQADQTLKVLIDVQ